jgi:glutaredoxin
MIYDIFCTILAQEGVVGFSEETRMQDKLRFKIAVTTLLGSFMLLGITPAQAGKLYKLVDEQGNITYSDTRPDSDAGSVEEQDVSPAAGEESAGLDQLADDTPIMFYSVPECAACDMVRTYLGNTGFPYTELQVDDDYDAQQKMKAAVGNLNVPTVTVGGRTLSGFNASALDAVLDVAGYPVGAEVPAAAATGSTTEAGAGDTEEADAEFDDTIAEDVADDLKENLQDEIETTNGDDTDADQ